MWRCATIWNHTRSWERKNEKELVRTLLCEDVGSAFGGILLLGGGDFFLCTQARAHGTMARYDVMTTLYVIPALAMLFSGVRAPSEAFEINQRAM